MTDEIFAPEKTVRKATPPFASLANGEEVVTICVAPDAVLNVTEVGKQVEFALRKMASTKTWSVFEGVEIVWVKLPVHVVKSPAPSDSVTK